MAVSYHGFTTHNTRYTNCCQNPTSTLCLRVQVNSLLLGVVLGPRALLSGEVIEDGKLCICICLQDAGPLPTDRVRVPFLTSARHKRVLRPPSHILDAAACAQVSFTFSLDPLVKGAAYGMAPYLMNTPVYIKPDAKGGSIAGLLAELGRVVDVLLSPITSPLAVILFLQVRNDGSAQDGSCKS